MKVKKINYNERAKFYDSEIKLDNKLIKLLYYTKNKFNFKTVVLCPCGSGRYVNFFEKLFMKSFFIDIEKSMLNKINKKIMAKKLKKIKTIELNMNNIIEAKKFFDCFDCIYCFNQGIQYLDLREFNFFLNSASLISKYLILDLFDFNSGKMLVYYDNRYKNNQLYLSKVFKYNNFIIKRYNRHKVYKKYTNFKYIYFFNNKKKYTTTFKLYNYPCSFIKKIIKNNEKFKIIKNINYLNGRYILILKRKTYELNRY